MLQEKIEAGVRQAKALDKNARNALQKLDEKVAEYAIRHLFDEIDDLLGDTGFTVLLA